MQKASPERGGGEEGGEEEEEEDAHSTEEEDERGDDDEDERQEEGVKVVLAAIMAAQHRRMHENEVRVVGGGGESGTECEDNNLRDHRSERRRRRRRPLRRFPSFDSLGRRPFACVRHLLLDANHLPSIPDDIGRSFPCLEGLVLTNEAMLSSLPPLLFCHLTRLQSLSIMKTSLPALPHSVSHLSALHILQLSSNKLTALPHTIGIDNQLTSLPPTIYRLTSLQILFLDNNRLTALPSEIASLPCTRHSFTFSVSNNLFNCTQDEMAFASVSSLLDLCCGAIAASVPDLHRLANVLPQELVAKLDQEARLCAGCQGRYYGSGIVQKRHPHRLADQDVVLESAFCSLRCAAGLPPLDAAEPRRGVPRALEKGSESMEELPPL